MSVRTWVPCLDAISTRCSWEFEFLVPLDCIVVASGELTDQVVSPSETTKSCHFKSLVPTSAHAIGFAAGPFEVLGCFMWKLYLPLIAFLKLLLSIYLSFFSSLSLFFDCL